MIAPSIPGITTIEITADQICALLSAIDTGLLELDDWLADNEGIENTARAGVEELKEQYEKLHAMLSRELEQLRDKEGDNGKKRRIDA